MSEADLDMTTVERMPELPGFSPPEEGVRQRFAPTIPKFVRESELLEQRPEDGKVLFIDSRDPETGIILKNNLGVGKNPEYVDISKIKGRNIAAIIYHTAPRTPENSYDEEVANAATLLGRRVNRDKNGKIIQQQLGALFIVEDLGQDKYKNWREMFIQNIGLVKPSGYGPSVRILDGEGFIVSQGRVKMERDPIDLEKSRAAGYIEDQKNKNVTQLNGYGQHVDTSELKQEIRRSWNPPRTIAGVVDFSRGITITDQLTQERQVRDKRGFVFEHKSASAEDYTHQEPEKPSREIFKLVKRETLPDVMCSDCGANLVQEDYIGNYADKESVEQGLYKLSTDYVCENEHNERGVFVAKLVGRSTRPITREQFAEAFEDYAFPYKSGVDKKAARPKTRKNREHPTEAPPMPNDVRVTEFTCPKGHGHYLKEKYFTDKKKPGRLYKRVFCNAAHADGLPQEYKWQFVRRLRKNT